MHLTLAGLIRACLTPWVVRYSGRFIQALLWALNIFSYISSILIHYIMRHMFAIAFIFFTAMASAQIGETYDIVHDNHIADITTSYDNYIAINTTYTFHAFTFSPGGICNREIIQNDHFSYKQLLSILSKDKSLIPHKTYWSSTVNVDTLSYLVITTIQHDKQGYAYINKQLVKKIDEVKPPVKTVTKKMTKKIYPRRTETIELIKSIQLFSL